jgi:hypothetical protein
MEVLIREAIIKIRVQEITTEAVGINDEVFSCRPNRMLLNKPGALAGSLN